ncbi:chromate transporter [Clostridium algidicarnis]|uniref:Chromate transporter n=1 Tax=Clostridium algidicarnis DSM 15099 TaxID=1121295 RepID=A0A2S6FUJ8_9CLOT|nr:chromate transporter [Clostridium algidicarnis]PPK43903.1 chromate transporter [Clostridium algidicarnis DSM 15099]
MNLYLKLFITFFKIGLFSFGGGYAMLPLIKQEVVINNAWLTLSEFTDIIAISQVTPGPIAINSATYIGYTATNSPFGSLLATLGVSLPSFIIMMIISIFFVKFKDNKYVDYAFKGIRPTVIGLIAAAALLLVNKSIFIDFKSIILFLGVFIASLKKVDPILLIAIVAIIGIIIY